MNDYRGKDKVDGKWHYGDIYGYKSEPKICKKGYTYLPPLEFILVENIFTDTGWEPDSKCYWIDPETIGYFIKHTDKNGNKIFTNDILFYEEESMFYVVKQDKDTAIGLACTQKRETITGLKRILNSDFCRKCEIIGNIYDNYLSAELKTEE